MKELTPGDTSLLELVGRLLNKGVVLAGEATISVVMISLPVEGPPSDARTP